MVYTLLFIFIFTFINLTYFFKLLLFPFLNILTVFRFLKKGYSFPLLEKIISFAIIYNVFYNHPSVLPEDIPYSLNSISLFRNNIFIIEIHSPLILFLIPSLIQIRPFFFPKNVPMQS